MLGFASLGYVGCVGGSDIEIITDAEPLRRDSGEDVVQEVRDAGNFTGCNPFTAADCDEGEKCAVSAAGSLTCTDAGAGELGDRCSPGLSSGCGVGLVCADTESASPCCAPFCQQASDCDTGACLIIARLPEGELGYCDGVCGSPASP